MARISELLAMETGDSGVVEVKMKQIFEEQDVVKTKKKRDNFVYQILILQSFLVPFL